VGFDTAFGVAVIVDVTVLTILGAFGLGAFGVVTVGVVGVPNFLAFNDLLLVSAIIFHRQILSLRLFSVLAIKFLFP